MFRCSPFTARTRVWVFLCVLSTVSRRRCASRVSDNYIFICNLSTKMALIVFLDARALEFSHHFGPKFNAEPMLLRNFKQIPFVGCRVVNAHIPLIHSYTIAIRQACAAPHFTHLRRGAHMRKVAHCSVGVVLSPWRRFRARSRVRVHVHVCIPTGVRAHFALSQLIFGCPLVNQINCVCVCVCSS